MTVLPQTDEQTYNDNIVVHSTIFDEVKDLIGGHTPSLEAYCNEHSNDRCSQSMLGDQFLMSEVQDNCIWLHPPYGHERLAIEHYKTCKEKEPTRTSAIIVVPTKRHGTFHAMDTIAARHGPPQTVHEGR